jgi:hypothetical protein
VRLWSLSFWLNATAGSDEAVYSQGGKTGIIGFPMPRKEVRMIRLAATLAAAFLLCTVTAQGSQQGQQAMRNFKAMDNCAKQAQAAYPEFNAVANAKRDAKLKECLNAGALPPRQPVSQPQSR